MPSRRRKLFCSGLGFMAENWKITWLRQKNPHCIGLIQNEEGRRRKTIHAPGYTRPRIKLLQYPSTKRCVPHQATGSNLSLQNNCSGHVVQAAKKLCTISGRFKTLAGCVVDAIFFWKQEGRDLELGYGCKTFYFVNRSELSSAPLFPPSYECIWCGEMWDLVPNRKSANM